MTCTHSCVRFVFRCCAHSSAYIVMGGLIKRVYTIVNILVCSFGTPFVTIGFSPEMNCRTRLWPAELRVWLRGYRNPRAQPKGGGTNGSQASWTFPFPSSSSSSSPSDKSPFLFLSYGRSWKIIAVATSVARSSIEISEPLPRLIVPPMAASHSPASRMPAAVSVT